LRLPRARETGSLRFDMEFRFAGVRGAVCNVQRGRS
jgi:hypothetical protein